MPGTAYCGTIVEADERGYGAHAAGAVVGDGEGGDDGFIETHELALGPSYTCYLVKSLLDEV